MANASEQQKSTTEIVHPKLKPVEQHCIRCGWLMVLNEKEECTECPNCGYIDCGDED